MPILLKWHGRYTGRREGESVPSALTGNQADVVAPHRPASWYLHIRSPLLPPGLSIPLRPARPEFVVSTMGVQDPTSTPLTFSLGTKVDYAALSNCKPWIQDWEEESKPAEGESSEPPAPGSGFIAVELNGMASHGNGEVSIDRPADTFVQGHTAQTSSISSMATLEPGHARRRSAGRNRSELPGAGSSPALRGFSGSFAKVEEQENESIADGADSNGSTTQQESSEAADKPSSIHRPPQLQQPLQNGSPPTQPCFSPRPLQCYFLMVDGAASSRPTSSIISPPLAPGRVAEGAHRLGWAKWIWSLVPAPVKPPLAFDTTKSFSVRWIEVPQSPGSPSSEQSQQQSIEVMRYEDEGGYWLWDSKTRGRFVYQEEAVRALGIDRGFWMAVGLAYLEFLEERDGFNASEG